MGDSLARDILTAMEAIEAGEMTEDEAIEWAMARNKMRQQVIEDE